MKSLLPFALLGLAVPSAYCAELSARDIVTQSIANYDKDWEAALKFSYTETEITKDSSDRTKHVELSRVSVLDGTPYSRLIAKDGHPLTGDEARKENEKFEKAMDTREHETPEQHARRLRKYRNEREFLHEIPNAFNMKLLAPETVNSRTNYVIELTPKEGYVPKAKNARMFSDIEGKLWVDGQDLRWTKAEANVINTISIGWFLARIGPGAHITLTQVKVDAEHWMPKQITVDGSARIMLVKNRAIDETITYADYKPIGKGEAAVSAKNR